ncbi:unnamed protein product [Boreogadus saida]
MPSASSELISGRQHGGEFDHWFTCLSGHLCIYYTICLEKDTLLDQYDDLSDLNAVQMESVREWEMQFMEKYDYVGRLLKPGDEPSEYTDEEDVKDHLKHD